MIEGVVFLNTYTRAAKLIMVWLFLMFSFLSIGYRVFISGRRNIGTAILILGLSFLVAMFMPALTPRETFHQVMIPDKDDYAALGRISHRYEIMGWDGMIITIKEKPYESVSDQ